MKKFLFIALFICCTLMFQTACGAGDIGGADYMSSKKAESEMASSKEAEPYWSSDLDGLCSCFEWRNYVVKDTKIETLADVIGAERGYKYESKVTKSEFDIELYYYNPENIDQIAKNTINQVKQTGELTVLNISVPAFISNNGKYIMVYTNTSGKEEDVKVREEIMNVFLNFN